MPIFLLDIYHFIGIEGFFSIIQIDAFFFFVVILLFQKIPLVMARWIPHDGEIVYALTTKVEKELKLEVSANLHMND